MSALDPQGALNGTRLMRLEDIAQQLSISRSMAWKLIAHGEIKSIRIGRAVRVRPTDLEAYLSQAARET